MNYNLTPFANPGEGNATRRPSGGRDVNNASSLTELRI